MCLILGVLSILLAQSDVQPKPAPQGSDQIILHITKMGGVGGIYQECLVFRNGRMVLPGGITLQLDQKEAQRLLSLAKQLPVKYKRKTIVGGRGGSHDYPLMYRVRINDAGQETVLRFPVETNDAAINAFVTAIVSHERSSKPQLKGP
ncbi:MAG: hypothetical protein EHM23_12000 [Acidobacteria bacterium]|nr:MAG: hypothetical protein EHM23_12000 [Acidobacteriota bacterium]